MKSLNHKSNVYPSARLAGPIFTFVIFSSLKLCLWEERPERAERSQARAYPWCKHTKTLSPNRLLLFSFRGLRLPQGLVGCRYFRVFDGLIMKNQKVSSLTITYVAFEIFKLISSDRIPWSCNSITTMETFSIALTSPISHSTLKASLSFTHISLENILSQQTNFTIYCITGCLFEQAPRLPSLKFAHIYPLT